MTEETLPPPRVSLVDASGEVELKDPLVSDSHYHLATLVVNDRTTAKDWYQDVRHIEFAFDHDISYAGI